MPNQTILVASDNPKAVEFLITYFSETQSILTVIRSKADLATVSLMKPNFIFFQGDWIDAKTSSRLNQFKSENPELLCFHLGPLRHAGFSWEGEIEFPLEEKAFRKVVLNKIKYQNPLKLLIVDDETEIVEIVQDYFEVRTDPPFQVRTAFNGLEGHKLIDKDLPNCLILDIKMPVKTGVELYRDVVRSGRKIPTIIFIDSTSPEDILEIRKWGNPVFVEKGGASSSMPDMLALVKKLVAFS